MLALYSFSPIDGGARQPSSAHQPWRSNVRNKAGPVPLHRWLKYTYIYMGTKNNMTFDVYDLLAGWCCRGASCGKELVRSLVGHVW